MPLNNPSTMAYVLTMTKSGGKECFLEISDVEHNWNVLKEVILKAQKCFSANCKAKQSHKNPWWSNSLTNAVKKNQIVSDL